MEKEEAKLQAVHKKLGKETIAETCQVERSLFPLPLPLSVSISIPISAGHKQAKINFGKTKNTHNMLVAQKNTRVVKRAICFWLHSVVLQTSQVCQINRLLQLNLCRSYWSQALDKIQIVGDFIWKVCGFHLIALNRISLILVASTLIQKI